jgi:hypothetical protein
LARGLCKAEDRYALSLVKIKKFRAKNVGGFMKCSFRLSYGLLLPAVIIVSGCESVALMPRPDVDRRSDSRRDRDVDRGVAPSRDYSGETQQGDRSGRQEEVVGTVESVNTAAREIRLRTPEARVVVIKYDPKVIVRSRDRELQVDSLRRGDLILVQISQNSRGERYADFIRMNDRQEMGSHSY